MKSYKSRSKFLIMPHLLTNFEIKTFYQNKPKFDSVSSLNNLPKIRDGACIINLD